MAVLIQRTIGIGFWLVVLAGIIIGALYFTGHFENTLTFDKPKTIPVCIDKMYVEIYKIDIGHQAEEHIPTLIFEGELNCEIIKIYESDPTLEVKYPNAMTITTSFDSRTNL